MAQHFWLMQRAITLQDRLLTQPELDHKTFGLYLRYQTTNESQKRQQEAHEPKIRLTNARAEAAEIKNYARSTMEVPLPGHIRVPFEDPTAAFRLTLQNINKQLSSD